MLFVMIGQWDPENEQEAIQRKMQFKYPDEVKVIGEYVLIGRCQVIAICETPSKAALVRGVLPFSGLMSFRFYPAMTSEEFLKIVGGVTG